jgi:hypothetical protein
METTQKLVHRIQGRGFDLLRFLQSQQCLLESSQIGLYVFALGLHNLGELRIFSNQVFTFLQRATHLHSLNQNNPPDDPSCQQTNAIKNFEVFNDE